MGRRGPWERTHGTESVMSPLRKGHSAEETEPAAEARLLSYPKVKEAA